MTNIELRSLAPEYNADDHETYVSRLNAAIEDPKNKNIALTGRYGAGKSSILDHFLEDQQAPPSDEKDANNTRDKKDLPKKTLRISINTLGPDDGEDLTNRIQKELVKQLVYRAKPGQLRTSRFARAPELTWWRSAIDAFIVAAVVVGLLWLFKVRPDKNSFGSDSMWLSMVVLFVLSFGFLWAVRWHIGRRTISQFSTGGASIAFEENTDSYFDKYLDELVAFFEATEPDLVVFEDLDRFDDPQIFDSLRELNTLVNASSHWEGRPDRPLRFVYAIKDSLFEKLGDSQHKKDATIKESGQASDGPPQESIVAAKKDTAAKAVERANRTKFFEIVIPVVPFLSHSNARDHFIEVLADLDLPNSAEISRGLIDVVARHPTDMRLMINIGNEFVVYAERLLWVEHPAPGMTANHLFALVVYKNFHLADFEALPHRGSVLDTLEQHRRDLVDAAITALQDERSELVRGEDRHGSQSTKAAILGERMKTWLRTTGVPLRSVSVHGVALDINAASEPAFWRPIAEAGEVEMVFIRDRRAHTSTLNRDELKILFVEATTPGDWLDSMSSADVKRQIEIDEQIAKLRGASYEYLIENEEYLLYGKSFATILKEVLLSDLARDLVSQGYLDRYYAEYATPFYGKFLGVDVANFFRNSVWPNEMDIQFIFTTENAVANVLEQAPADFLRTRSVLNIEVINHIVDAGGSSATDIVGFLARQNNEDARLFLKTYFNTPGARSHELVSLLVAKPWPELFNFIADENTIEADETKTQLFSAALLHARTSDTYGLSKEARAMIAHLHTEIAAFTEPQRGVSPDILFSFLASPQPSIPSLRLLAPELQIRAVRTKQYELSADNLRVAASLGDTDPISADTLIGKPAVWQYCAERIDDYLDLVAADEHTTSSCASPEILAEVVNAQYEAWTPEQLEAFLTASSAVAALPDIALVEQATWQMVIEAHMVIPNVINIHAYATEIGVDATLAALLLTTDGSVINIPDTDDATCEQLEPLIPRVLNAPQVFSPSQRVALASQLVASPATPGMNMTDIEATPDELFAELLRAGLVQDTRATFDYFSKASSPSIMPALRVSANAAQFITPDLVSGYAAEIVRDTQVLEATRRAVLAQLSTFALIEDPSFLTAAAQAARALNVVLPTGQLKLLAPHVRAPEDALWQLKQNGASIAAPTALEILALIPGSFAGFAEHSDHEFEVPDTPSLAAVLDQLKAARVIKFPRGRPIGRRKVRIA